MPSILLGVCGRGNALLTLGYRQPQHLQPLRVVRVPEVNVATGISGSRHVAVRSDCDRVQPRRGSAELRKRPPLAALCMRTSLSPQAETMLPVSPT